MQESMVSHEFSYSDMNDQDEGIDVKKVNFLQKKETVFDFQSIVARPLSKNAVESSGRFPAKSLVISRSPSVVKEDGSEIEYTTTKKVSITPFQEIE